LESFPAPFFFSSEFLCTAYLDLTPAKERERRLGAKALLSALRGRSKSPSWLIAHFCLRQMPLKHQNVLAVGTKEFGGLRGQDPVGDGQCLAFSPSIRICAWSRLNATFESLSTTAKLLTDKQLLPLIPGVNNLEETRKRWMKERRRVVVWPSSSASLFLGI
jgi:hypothetical protein